MAGLAAPQPARPPLGSRSGRLRVGGVARVGVRPSPGLGAPRAGGATITEMTERSRRRATVVAGLAVAVGLSAWAALTVPLTSGADAVTAVGLGLVTIEVAARWRRPAVVPNLSARAAGE